MRELGFEMVIMTLGAGSISRMRSRIPGPNQRVSRLCAQQKDRARGYSLLASRSINAENDVICPGGARFGNSLAWAAGGDRTTSQAVPVLREPVARSWNTTARIRGFLRLDQSPGHRGLKDSQWKQWQMISDFYKWCRARAYT